MRPLIYYVAVSLDGFIADPAGNFDAFDAEGDHMATILSEFADALPQPALAALGVTPPRTVFDTVLMGSATYAVGADVGLSSPYPHLRQFVFSRSDRAVPDEVTLTAESPSNMVGRLKSEEGQGIWLCGGGVLAASLIDDIDRLILKVNPILLGAGIPLFAGARPGVWGFDLTRSRAYESGVLINEYQRTGPATEPEPR
ncbi:dihydrofolate reductase family protein [Gordonia sp. NPDC003950]